MEGGYRPKAKLPRPVRARSSECRRVILELERWINESRQVSVVEWVNDQPQKPGTLP